MSTEKQKSQQTSGEDRDREKEVADKWREQFSPAAGNTREDSEDKHNKGAK